MYETRPARQVDVIAISDNIRKSDVEEVYAATGLDITEALIVSFNSSYHCWVTEADGELVAIYGVSPSPNPFVGIPWMLATDDIYKHKKQLLRQSRDIVNQMQSIFPVLTNFVDERNTKSIRYLKMLGFEFPKRVEHFGYEGRPFWQFERKQYV